VRAGTNRTKEREPAILLQLYGTDYGTASGRQRSQVQKRKLGEEGQLRASKKKAGEREKTTKKISVTSPKAKTLISTLGRTGRRDGRDALAALEPSRVSVQQKREDQDNNRRSLENETSQASFNRTKGRRGGGGERELGKEGKDGVGWM